MAVHLGHNPYVDRILKKENTRSDNPRNGTLIILQRDFTNHFHTERGSIDHR
jgi:hypothetical protein